jgi:hypothetical protein
MANNLYQEAIAEARQLKEMAEQNAKNKIIDAVTPRIRALIEQQLLGEQAELDEPAGLEDMFPEELPDDEAPLGGDIEVLDLGALGQPPEQQPKISVTAGNVEIEIGEEDEGEEDEDLLLSTESIDALRTIIRNGNSGKTFHRTQRRIKEMSRRVRHLDRIIETLGPNRLSPSQRKSVRNYYTVLLREIITLRKRVILMERDTGRSTLQGRVENILKEMRNMSKRRSKNAIFDRLFERSGKLNELEAVLSLTPDDEDEGTEVEDLLADLEISMEVEDAEGGGEDEDAEEEGDEDMEDEGGEEELELEADLIVIDNADEEEVVEIDESMLRRELRRMRRIAEQTDGAEDVDQSADAFGGGDSEEEAFVDVDEDALLNALADELGSNDGGSPTVESRRRRRSRKLSEIRRNKRARAASNKGQVKEGRQNRALKVKLVEYKKAILSLRKQLTEMNLFNAKLLYANKLMQNRNVTPRQQRSIVEALDNAKTLREAKLLYKSLTSSLNKKGTTLTEGRNRRTLGSSSRSTRPAGVKSGVEVDRWAVLAGISGENK